MNELEKRVFELEIEQLKMKNQRLEHEIAFLRGANTTIHVIQVPVPWVGTPYHVTCSSN